MSISPSSATGERGYDGSVTTPKRDRPQLPTGYITGALKGMLTWTRARSEKLIAFDVKKFSTSAARFTLPAIR